MLNILSLYIYKAADEIVRNMCFFFHIIWYWFRDLLFIILNAKSCKHSPSPHESFIFRCKTVGGKGGLTDNLTVVSILILEEAWQVLSQGKFDTYMLHLI